MTIREDSIAAFYSDKLIIDLKGSIPSGALYKAYQSYCDDSGLKPRSHNNFSDDLIQLCNDSLGHSIAKIKRGGNRFITGIRLREDWEFEEDTSVTTGEKCPPSPTNKNQNFSIELEEAPQAPLLAQDNGLEAPLGSPSLHATNVVDTDHEFLPNI